MKDFEDAVPIIVAIFVALILFFGFMTTLRKSLKGLSPEKDTIDSSMKLREQKRLMDDIQRRQKDLMRDQKQRIRDLQRK